MTVVTYIWICVCSLASLCLDLTASSCMDWNSIHAQKDIASTHMYTYLYNHNLFLKLNSLVGFVEAMANLAS